MVFHWNSPHVRAGSSKLVCRLRVIAQASKRQRRKQRGTYPLITRRSGRIGGECSGTVSAPLVPARTRQKPNDAVTRFPPVRRGSGHWLYRTATLDVYLLSRF